MAFSQKTLREAGLLPAAGVGSVVTARCGDAPTSQSAQYESCPLCGLPWPQPKSSASEPLVVFKQALTTICSPVARKFNFNVCRTHIRVRRPPSPKAMARQGSLTPPSWLCVTGRLRLVTAFVTAQTRLKCLIINICDGVTAQTPPCQWRVGSQECGISGVGAVISRIFREFLGGV
jgi:hypothetical protein